MKRNLLTCFAISLLLVWSAGWADAPTAQPFQSEKIVSQYEHEAKKPNFVTMTADAVFARPVLLAITLVGAGLFVVTLPFSLISKNVKQTGHTLVATPAKAAFARCLGCSFNDDAQNKS